MSNDSVCSSLLTPSKVLLDAIPTAEIVEQIAVNVIALDEIDYPPSKSMWLKLDVQGFEKHALEGAKTLLRKVKVLELELSINSAYSDSYTLESAIPNLAEMGFSVVSLGRGVSDRKTGQLIDADFLLERI